MGSESPVYVILSALFAALVGGVELRLAVHRLGKRLHAFEHRLAALETPKPDSWKYPTIAARGAGLLLLVAMLGLSSCAPTPRSAVDQLRADTVAEASATSPHDRAVAAAAVKADAAAVPVVERLSERHALLRIAVAAIAVVAGCLVGAAWYPMLGTLLRAIAGVAGLFGAGVLALRSFLAVPEWVALSVFASAAAIAVFAMLRHGKSASATVHDLVAAGGDELATVTGKARAFVVKVAAWRKHHVSAPVSKPAATAPAAPTAAAA